MDLIEALSTVGRPWLCELDADEWAVIQLTYRYTGARLEEVAGMSAEWVGYEHGIPYLKMRAGKANLRKSNLFEGGFKKVPIHPRLEDPLLSLARRSGGGRLFPNSGMTQINYKKRSAIKYGKEFSKTYLPEARKIWAPMKVHCWRSYVIHYLTKIAQVPEILSMDIVGHAGGTVHRDYAGMADLKTLYEVIKKLP